MDGFGAVIQAVKYAGLWHVMKLGCHATLDIFAALFRMDPHFIPAAGRPGEICDKETVAPIPAALEAAKRMPRAEVKHYDLGHFDIYQGEAREGSIKDQLEFLGRHMPVGAKPAKI
ncbi:hypothetical protein DFJ74DRAFT_702344 [Hyaloraphidium curvatum]|nr:hypothetical protein DFJ74DRAFT_702344 [Hyaloraphidium curvatum]